jgi:transglutaminase superfamily protein
VFDPLLLKERYVNVTVTAESTLLVPDSAAWDSTAALWIAARWDTLSAWHIVQNDAGLSVQSWIDELGQVVEATSPIGFTMRRTAFEIASLNFQLRDTDIETLADGLGGDIIRQTAIASDTPLETDDITELRVRLQGVDLDEFDLSGDRQELSGDTLVIRRETEEQLTNDSERFTAARMQELSEWVGPDPLIQTRDPRIQAQARQITDRYLSGRRRDYVRAAEALNEWVYENLEKQITVSVPSALEVLENRRGDCNEHTVLYVALARAAGIPARTAAGLVYSDGSFYYHAWPEVYLNGWVAVDPTFGQFPADASHLRFTIGGLARQMELVRLIGRLQLEVTFTEN